MRLLEAMGWSVAANEAWRWGTILFNRLAGADLPVLFIGLPLLAVLAARIVLPGNLARVAILADGRLRLADRLTSYVDFGSRDDVPDGMRRAQAAETAHRLAGVDPARAFRPGPYRLLTVPLLALMIWFTYLNPFMPHRSPGGPGVKVARVTGDGPGEDAGAPGLAGRRAAGDLPDGLPEEPAPGESPKDSAGGTTPPAPPAAAADKTSEGEPPDPGRSSRGGDRRRSGPGGRGGRGPRTMQEPIRLVSETVGQSLTPVTDRTAPGRPAVPERVEPPAASPRGLIALDLLPRDMDAAPGRRGGGHVGTLATPTRIEIDFDAVPEEYREYVRRYFVNLGLLDNGGRRGIGTTN